MHRWSRSRSPGNGSATLPLRSLTSLPRHLDLASWLRWQETLNPSTIELGLDRVREVWGRIHPRGGRLPFPVITVGGTNGKGSCVAMLEAIYRAGGYRTGCYSSPHLLRYTERIRLDGAEVGEGDLCAAFERVDQARGETRLTFFEFGTLAALDLFVRMGPDVAILEVGLGGRLDAVNLIDPDLALVTTIGRDHMAWLGDTLDAIALEKAGIFRPGRPALIGSREPPRPCAGGPKKLAPSPSSWGRSSTPSRPWRAGAGRAQGRRPWPCHCPPCGGASSATTPPRS